MTPPIKLQRFRPRLLSSLRGYNKALLGQDVLAGITVGVVALPLAMAFAIASGLPPQAGLFTAIVAGFIIAALGGANVQIGGPAGAFVVVVLGIVQQHGVVNLLVSTFVAGGLLIVMGWLGLGSLVRLMPVSIVIGFTNGIAVLIGLSQVSDFLGLPAVHSDHFFERVGALLQALPNFNTEALALSSACLVVLLGWSRLVKSSSFSKVPVSVVVVVGGTAAATALGLNVDTIGGRFGEIPASLPALAIPEVHWAALPTLIGPILTIAFLCAVESLLCARVADGMTHDKHNPNQELMAQGVANMASALVGGMPATGTIARTVTNIRSGAKTPVSGMVHALTLLLIMVLAAPLASHVPLPVLSAILMFVAINMGEWSEFKALRRYNPVYRIIVLATFILTVVVDLTVAVEVGLALSALFFIYRVSSLTQFIPIALPETPEHVGLKAYSIYGSLFFGVVGKIESLCADLPESTHTVLLDLHQTISIDTTALDALRDLKAELDQQGVRLRLCGANPQALSLFKRSGFIDALGPDHPADSFQMAMKSILQGGPDTAPQR
ncbi:MAG: SulP family inorganic anion transporter [Limnobacter sp.]|uniref:SulP family inorganic anion transporter n=1 Tax=Limnobacter sp. TaxID=2003368 RepID=UPI00391CAB22